ncbi:hypothetical protein F5Y19DRAFT_409236 [Xylariaceae sp. FL1651]|nr:hypothetical protein F5Y19DRAFT_409236 [Xylariaceae sp. FL1651]
MYTYDEPCGRWSAIQTLLERSLSDALILLDCCAGAASAAFPTGNSITETISASSWDAIAPNPGRYSFTSTLIEVLQEWKRKTFSAAMLHAEILARLKHPRPERRNGNHFEARTTPVHFMMTANHRAPSIEICKMMSHDNLPILLPPEPTSGQSSIIQGRASTDEIIGSEPNESVPHVMISLALENDQSLNVDDWERWLASIPALAKYVQVQGVFKSHSTLLLLSLPVMVWDMLPDHHACNFIAFIRSNNLATQGQWKLPLAPGDEGLGTDMESDQESVYSGTTAFTLDHLEPSGAMNWSMMDPIYENIRKPNPKWSAIQADAIPRTRSPLGNNVHGWLSSATQPSVKGDQGSPGGAMRTAPNIPMAQQPDQIRTSRSTSRASDRAPIRPVLPAHVQKRLEEYFIDNPKPTVAVKEFLASNLGIETADIDGWFHNRREQQEVSNKLQSLRMDDQSHSLSTKDGARMILPGHLNKLLEMFPTGQIVVIDLRSRADYRRSHIHGAVNFRAPASFVARASIEMIEKVLTDEASRSSFDKWYTSKCVVFYDKCVEYPWEAPVAEAFFQKFKSKNWPGQCFVLKGHYREFSQSFDKYIVGVNTTDKATEYLASLQDVSWEKSKDDHQRYDDWLKLLDDEDRVHMTELAPAVKSERLHATVLQQKVLEDEFERTFPYLHRQAQARKPDDNWSIKAPMVAHLERGLAKMQQEAGSSRPLAVPPAIEEGHNISSGGSTRQTYDNNNANNAWRLAGGLPEYMRYPDTNDIGGKDYARKEGEEEYRHHHHQQHLNIWQGAGPTLHKSSSSSTLKPKSSDEPNNAHMPTLTPAPTSTTATMAAMHPDKRNRSSSGGGKNLFTRLIRSGRPDAPR